MSFEEKDDQDLLDKIGKESKKQDNNSTDEKSIPWGPQRKRRRLRGYKEDPYIFFKENEPVWDDLKQFYDLDDAFNKMCLLTRCDSERKKNIYYCSNPIRDIVLLNENFIKIINTGVKTFVRCENRHTKHPFRLAQEGLQTSNSFLGSTRRIQVQRDDLILLLNCTDPTKPPSTEELVESTRESVMKLDVGSCILKYVDERFTLFVVGWRGTSSLRAYVDTNETVHILRLLKADLYKFEINKFKKIEDSVEIETEGGKDEDKNVDGADVSNIEKDCEDKDDDIGSEVQKADNDMDGRVASEQINIVQRKEEAIL